MKILILANNDVGLFKFRKELIKEMLENHEVYISLPYGELVDPLVDIGCKFIDTPLDRRGINPVTDLSLLTGYKKMFKQLKPDLVITYTIKPNIYGSLIAKKEKIEYAVNITGLGTTFQKDSLLKEIVIIMYRYALKNVKIVFFENEGNKQVFVDENIVNEDKAYCLNGAGVNLKEYPFTAYPSEEEPLRFLFIGRIMKEKGIDEYLYSAREIKKRYPNIQFDVVGTMEEQYKDIIDKYTTDKTVNYHGYQKDVKPFIASSYCLVLPSCHEGMANTLLEAASMGRPLITSNIHGCKEAVIENVSGLLCKAQKSENLYKVMKKFIKLPYEQKMKMGLEGRRWMEIKFDKGKVVKETLRVLGV